MARSNQRIQTKTLDKTTKFESDLIIKLKKLADDNSK